MLDETATEATRLVTEALSVRDAVRVRPVDGGYLLFIGSPSGYELREESGEPPTVDAEVDGDDGRLRVTKVAPSPLPNDPRPCAYVQAV